MKRTIIQIDPDLCNGCGLCVSACHEGAIGLVDGKATLLREDYCDGMGDCLPACPTGAITFIEKEAPAYDEAAVIAAQMARAKAEAHASMPMGCPGSAQMSFDRSDTEDQADAAGAVPSQLAQWPCQIKLINPAAQCFDGARLLVAADCCAYAYGDFHREFMKGKVTIIGCPKLDGVDYAEKLHAILASNDISDVVVTRMEVPCCGGIESAVRRAAASCGRPIPVTVVTIASNGDIVSVAEYEGK